MHAHQRWAGITGQVFVAPLGQVGNHRVEVAAHGGQPVFVAQGPFLVGHFLQYPAIGELAQPVAEHMAGDAQPLLEIIKTAHPEKAVAQHQQRPVIANNGQRTGQ